MSWLFGKKKEASELPELPPLTDSSMRNPMFPEDKELTIKKEELPELPSLPSFPSSPSGNKITNAVVKQAINDTEENYEISEEDQFPSFRQPEDMKILPPLIQKPLTRELDESPTLPIKPLVKEAKTKEILPSAPSSRIEPIFVRIDKYHESLNSFQEIKKKVLEIENLLKDIKDLKTKEELELTHWEQEIQQAKIKLDNIDKTLFGKV